MKKFITAILALTLAASMGVTAFAADTTVDETATLPIGADTSVTFTVDPTYTVTIPEKVELTKQSDENYAGSGTISTSAIRLKMDENIVVKIASDFIMETAEGATQSYAATIDGKATVLTNNAVIALFHTNEQAQSVKLNFAAANPKYAGMYSDTVTFNIAIETIA